VTPADEIAAAAQTVRKLTAVLPANDWGNRPWHAEECSDTDTMDNCPCIVAQGEYREFDQPQVPLIQYVADAEAPEFAAYIAAMHPGVGAALAGWLEITATSLTASTHPDWQDCVAADALAVARAILGTQETT
jgi:hypothetical protein